MGYAFHMWVTVWNGAQHGQFNDFLHLKNIDGEQLPPPQTKHQQLEAIFAHKPGSLINGIQ
ncbi:hypothetical protein GCM10011613_16980 [Cellvibrio zantedeschiae]|uniref:Uncharacterized protein n=1 Tax=Cellvibrio zantedeschiae TaxID=1237077 RepID=A0ABQ3B0L0_9GAMM|nr:hypothetical protein GCM10011613_16980 [Cellvibrio zantedeschiae]